jgi:SAM-dependent methyltransferase
VEEAVRTGWWEPGARVLDVGCGSGWIAAFLAERGFKVMGVDYAQAAVERARADHGEIPGRLEWAVADAAAGPIPGGPFDALLDRGCMIRIPKDLWPDYVRTLHRVSHPGTRFLLLLAPIVNKAGARQRLRERIGQVFERRFRIERVEEIRVELRGGDRDALAVWMTAV